MTEQTRRPSPKDFDPYADQAPTGSVESGKPGGDAAEVDAPPNDLDWVGDAEQPGASTAEAIDRATAAVGHDDGKR